MRQWMSMLSVLGILYRVIGMIAGWGLMFRKRCGNCEVCLGGEDVV